MSTLMNPFIMTGHIPSEYFCDRVEETKRLVQEITGRATNILLMSERRLGKTSLIEHCFEQPQIKDNFYTFYFDILHTSDFNEFIYEFQKQVFDALMPRGQKVWSSFLQAVRSVTPKFSVDPLTGMPTFALELGNITAPETTLDEILAYLEKADKPCVVAIDEFQRITRYQEKNIEAMLRGKIQHLSNTRFVFAGSERHILADMFGSYNRPFYHSTMVMSLERIDIDVYANFAQRQFERYEKSIEEDTLHRLYSAFDGNTFCMQKMLHVAFNKTPIGGICGLDTINQVLSEILSDNEHAYRENLSRMGVKQKAVLYAIAIEGVARQVTSVDFITRHSLGTASSVQAALRVLLENDWITVSNKEYTLSDKFMSLWLKRQSGNVVAL